MPDRALKRVDTVKRFLQMDISKEKELQQIVELAANMCDVPVAMITFMDNETQHIKFKVGTDLTEVSYQDTFCRHTIAQKELLVITDTAADERVKDNPFVVRDPHVRFYAGSPLTTYDHHNMGTLCVFDLEPKVLTVIQEKMLHRLARQVTRLLQFDASLQLLKEQYEFSRIEETKLRFFFESSASCHLLLDTQLRLLSFNSATVNVLKNSYGLPIAEGMEVTDYIEPGFLDEFVSNCKSALRGEIVIVDTNINSPKGHIPWHLTFEPALDSESAIIGLTFSATDITQMVKNEKKVMDQGESLRQIDRILSADLHRPMELIKDAMASLKQQGYPDDVIEFELLERACDELADRGNFILSPDQGNAGIESKKQLLYAK